MAGLKKVVNSPQSCHDNFCILKLVISTLHNYLHVEMPLQKVILKV